MNTDHQARFDSLYEQHLRALKRHGKAVKTIEAYSLGVRRLAQIAIVDIIEDRGLETATDPPDPPH